jgi:shikimate kinase
MKGYYLIGFRAAGKTTLGRRLAAELGHGFLDLDEEWEKRSGRGIGELVAEQGIEAFRREEEKLLRELDGKSDPTWIATGGGIVEWEPSLQILARSRREKIYLEVPAEELWRRLEPYPERKKIGNLHNFSALEALLEKRRPLYEKIATRRLENRVITSALNDLKTLIR